ncbi:MAG: diguanylate cyclase [Lachnospiraceae bacterium]|nr:diguanylate cyclase [Lachnospiraceae bacterium]
MKKLSLNRTQLKIIAIISMVIDHTAWGFVDFYSPLGQFLHVCGRLTVPIMCFFIAEGFRKTSDLKKYIYRMAMFAAVSIIPFYLFFHEEYDYRQNIIFDLLLWLLVLTVLESRKLKKPAKIILTVLLFAVSATIGGWIITPIMFILAFYYGKTFKQKAIWFIIADVVTVGFLMVSISLNNIFHFSKYEWLWWDKSYLLGFMLALPLLYCYNGEKGKNFGGRYFFYIFYPAHFLVLSAIKAFTAGLVTPWGLYIGVHIAGFVLVLAIMLLTVFNKPSRGQNSVLFMEFGALTYTMGFILEILSDTAEGVHFACMVEYFGEYILFIAVVFFVSVLTSTRIPNFVYALLTVISIIFLYMLGRTRVTHFFYKVVDVNFDGPFSRPELVYGPGFYISIIYILMVSIITMTACLGKLKSASPIEKKRLLYVLISLVFCWIPYVIKLLGLTGGYEIPALGIVGAVFCMYLCLNRLGFLDSVMLASTNALDHGREGILVVDSNYRVQYQNNKIGEIFGQLPLNTDLRKNEKLGPILNNETLTLKVEERIFDFVQEPLIERNNVQGYMLWVIDNTEHYNTMQKIHELAIRDALTGLYNRNHFQELVEEDLDGGRHGAMVMIDMDNFKQVNDRNGHQCGDAVLIALANILSGIPEDRLYSARLGGDEFCVFLRGITDKEKIGEHLQDIMDKFEKEIGDLGYAGITSLSIGAVSSEDTVGKASFKKLYSLADKVLYEAKMSGKRRYVIK